MIPLILTQLAKNFLPPWLIATVVILFAVGLIAFCFAALFTGSELRLGWGLINWKRKSDEKKQTTNS